MDCGIGQSACGSALGRGAVRRVCGCARPRNRLHRCNGTCAGACAPLIPPRCPQGHHQKMAVYGLNLYYKDFHALKNIDLEFPTNQVTALIGPSGCGKSTSLKSLNRMNDLVEGCRIEGRITLDGVDAYRSVDVNNLRRRVGMVRPAAQSVSHERVRQRGVRLRARTASRSAPTWTRSSSGACAMPPSGTS